MSKREPKKKNFVVRYDVKLHGSIVVEALSAVDARAEWMKAPEYDQATSELTDWECLSVKEEP